MEISSSALQKRYGEISDDELLKIYRESEKLTVEAQELICQEFKKRGLTEKDIISSREKAISDYHEIRNIRQKAVKKDMAFMWKGLYFILIVIVGSAIKVTVDRYFGPIAKRQVEAVMGPILEKNTDPNLSDLFVDISRKMNETLPRDTNSEIILHTTIPGPGKKMTYVYFYKNITSNQVDPDEFTKQMRQALIDHSCGNQKIVLLLKTGAIICHQYNGFDKKLITEICLSIVDCNN